MVKVSTEEKTTMKQSSNKEHKIQPRRKTRVGDKPESGKTRVYRNYERSDLVLAAKKVREENMTIYKVSKLTNVPYNTIKSFLNENKDLDHAQMPKLGRPFALPVETEHKIVKFITDMQELGFGLSVMQVRKLAYDLAGVLRREHFLNSEKKIASKWWWSSFKERYGLCLRLPENLSAYRASMSNPIVINDYYEKLDDLLTKLDIKNQPSQIWNVDETGLAYVVKSNKVVCKIGKKYVYKRTYGEKAQTQTLVGCACADGTFLPPFIIFKGVRWTDSLKMGCLPSSEIRISPKGWITSDLFLEWFTFFINSIRHDHRPVVLLMDSHSSHITPAVIELAKQNHIFLMTFPAHTSHLLQPLDVGVYRSLKAHWSQQLNQRILTQPHDKPGRSNFHELFNPAFLASFTPANIINAFKKAGACPLNYDAIPSEAVAPSKITDKPIQSSEQNIIAGDSTNLLSTTTVDDLLQTPKARSKPTQNGSKRRVSTAKCLTPPGENLTHVLPGPSGIRFKDSEKKKVSCSTQDDDWICGSCRGKYSDDVKRKTGASWVQCSFCLTPYHEDCQEKPTKNYVYMCDKCGQASDSSDGEN